MSQAKLEKVCKWHVSDCGSRMCRNRTVTHKISISHSVSENSVFHIFVSILRFGIGRLNQVGSFVDKHRSRNSSNYLLWQNRRILVPKKFKQTRCHIWKNYDINQFSLRKLSPLTWIVYFFTSKHFIKIVNTWKAVRNMIHWQLHLTVLILNE